MATRTDLDLIGGFDMDLIVKLNSPKNTDALATVNGKNWVPGNWNGIMLSSQLTKDNIWDPNGPTLPY